MTVTAQEHRLYSVKLRLHLFDLLWIAVDLLSGVWALSDPSVLHKIWS